MTEAIEAVRSTPAVTTAATLLSVRNIEVVYDDVILVLRGLSLEVPKGAIVALLGANGAGKSTTLKAISGLLKTEDGEVTRGEIIFEGERINGIDPDKIVRRGIVQVMEGRRIVTVITSVENLRLGAFTRSRRTPKPVAPPAGRAHQPVHSLYQPARAWHAPASCPRAQADLPGRRVPDPGLAQRRASASNCPAALQ